MRKAQGLPMNVIIIAALALLVLVVVAVIFAGWGGIFNKGTKACLNNGGKCFDDACGTGKAVDYPTQHPTATCGEKNCCLPAGG